MDGKPFSRRMILLLHMSNSWVRRLGLSYQLRLHMEDEHDVNLDLQATAEIT
jgi:hypothetical protein